MACPPTKKAKATIYVSRSVAAFTTIRLPTTPCHICYARVIIYHACQHRRAAVGRCGVNAFVVYDGRFCKNKSSKANPFLPPGCHTHTRVRTVTPIDDDMRSRNQRPPPPLSIHQRRRCCGRWGSACEIHHHHRSSPSPAQHEHDDTRPTKIYRKRCCTFEEKDIDAIRRDDVHVKVCKNDEDVPSSRRTTPVYSTVPCGKKIDKNVPKIRRLQAGAGRQVQVAAAKSSRCR